MKTWIVLFIGLLALPAAAQTPLEQTFAAGETLDYDLTWLHITGGAARLTIAPAANDPLHFRMTSVGKSSASFNFIYKVRDEMQSWVNRDDFSTIRYEKHLNERGRRKDDTSIIDERRRIATRRRPNKDTEEISVPKPVFDPLSLVYHLRTLPLEPGTVQRFTVFSDGKVYTLEAQVVERQTIDTPAGSFHTIMVQPKMLAGGMFRGEGTLSIWYTDDERHIPVRIRSDLKIGSITAALRAVHSGVTSTEPVLGR